MPKKYDSFVSYDSSDEDDSDGDETESEEESSSNDRIRQIQKSEDIVKSIRNSSSNNAQEPQQFRRLRKVLKKNIDLLKDHVEDEIPPTSAERRAILQQIDANYKKREAKKKRALERGTSVLSPSSTTAPKKRSSSKKQVVVHQPLVKKKNPTTKKVSPKKKVRKPRQQKSLPTIINHIESFDLSCGEKLVKKGTVKIGTKKRTHYTIQKTPLKKIKGFIYRVFVNGNEFIIKTTKKFEL